MKIQYEKNRKVNYWSMILGFLVFLNLLSCKTQSVQNSHSDNIQHGIVYYKEGRFAGWPANHGIWSWDNEILVGFVEAAHMDSEGFHTYDRSTASNKYARSKDGGKTWSIKDAYEHGQTARGYDNNINKKKAMVPSLLNDAINDFTNPDFILTFLRHNNHNGPSHFYYSNNRGAIWEGPFIFPNLNTNGVATRTDYIIDGKKELNAFLTVAKSNDKEGRVVMSRTTDGGLNWEIVSWIGPEPEGFDIMPSSLRLSPNELITVIRTRTGNGQDLLTSYLSENNGETWEKLKDPVTDTGRGGSPPAMVKMKDGRLALAYIYRSGYGSRVNIRFSSNNGRSWSDEIILRCCDGATYDVGYPHMVQRPDGKLVIIYYWNNANEEGAKPYRYIASTIVDPDQWK
jgi:hypothetical protein